MSAKLIHTVSLNRNSATARFYLWLYEATPARMDTCKLFWGLVLAPLLILPILLIKGAAKLADLWVAKHPRKPKVYKLRKTREEKLESFSGRASASYAKYQTAFRIAGIVLGTLLGLGILGYLVYLCGTVPLKVLVVLAWIVGTIILLGFIVLLINFLSNGRGKGFVDLLVALARSVHQRTCAKIDLQ